MKYKDTSTEVQEMVKKQREYMVVKSNDIIQKARYSMTAQQQKVLLIMISKIKPHDAPQTMYTISVKEFCLLCNIDYTSGKHYEAVKQSLYNIDKQVLWLKEPDKKKQTRLRWLNRLIINEGSGTIEFSFHEDMFPYLFDLKKQCTKYGLINALPVKSKYTIPLYELLKSYAGLVWKRMGDGVTIGEQDTPRISFNLETLKQLLDADNYEFYKDFKKRVLNPAIEEINAYTDLEVEFEAKASKGGRAYNTVVFLIYPVLGDYIEEINRDAERIHALER